MPLYCYFLPITHRSAAWFVHIGLTHCNSNKGHYYPTLLPRVQISRETSTKNRYLYSPYFSRPREVQNLGKSEFWEKKLLDNKSLIRRFGVQYRCIFLLVVCILTQPTGSSKYCTTLKIYSDTTPKCLIRYIYRHKKHTVYKIEFK